MLLVKPIQFDSLIENSKRTFLAHTLFANFVFSDSLKVEFHPRRGPTWLREACLSSVYVSIQSTWGDMISTSNDEVRLTNIITSSVSGEKCAWIVLHKLTFVFG